MGVKEEQIHGVWREGSQCRGPHRRRSGQWVLCRLVCQRHGLWSRCHLPLRSQLWKWCGAALTCCWNVPPVTEAGARTAKRACGCGCTLRNSITAL